MSQYIISSLGYLKVHCNWWILLVKWTCHIDKQSFLFVKSHKLLMIKWWLWASIAQDNEENSLLHSK